MGVGPSKEKLIQLLKESSNKDNEQNNYKLEFRIDQENEIYGGDDESLDDQNYRYMGPNKIKEVKRFPYVAIGTITCKFSSNEINEHTCFLISGKVIITLLSFIRIGKKYVSEVTTTFSEEKLNIKNCKKYEKKNLAIFFLEDTNFSQWIGVDEHINTKKNVDKKTQKAYEQLKIIYSTGKGSKMDLERSSNVIFIDENMNGDKEKLYSLLEEVYFDGSINKLINEKNIKKNDLIGGVICYKNQQNGGVYAVGVVDKNLQPFYFDGETVNILYKQVYKSTLSNTEGIDENIIYDLDLSKKSLGPTHIKLLTEFNLQNLKKLNLLKNQIGPQGAFYLGQSKFTNLEILILNFNEIGDEGIQYLSKGPFLGLKYLFLFHNNISNIGVKSILDSLFNDSLLLLDLSDNPNINAEGVEIIKTRIQENNNVLKELLCLNLSGTSINSDIAIEELDQIQFPKLKKLILQEIDFSKCKNYHNFLKNKKYEIKTGGLM